jgi:hypothetical protein
MNRRIRRRRTEYRSEKNVVGFKNFCGFRLRRIRHSIFKMKNSTEMFKEKAKAKNDTTLKTGIMDQEISSETTDRTQH